MSLNAYYFEICAAHRRALLRQVAAQDATRTVVDECFDAASQRKAQWRALPDYPETGDTPLHTSPVVEKEPALARKEKIENQKNVSKRNNHHHAPQIYWYEYVG